MTPLRELCDKGRGHRVQQPNALPEVRSKQSGSDIATIIYTSGTTGNPKGVIVSHEAFTVGTKYGVQALPVQPHDTQVLFLPLAHSFAKMLEIVAVRVGFCTAFSGIDNLVDNLGEVKPTFMAGVPRIYEKVYSGFLSKAKEGGAVKWKLVSWAIEVGTAASREIQAGRKPGGLLAVQYALADKLVFSKLRARFGGRLRWFVSGSAPLSHELAEFFHAAGMLILEGYGLTETNSLTSVNRADKYKFGTVGQALAPELQVRIAPDGEILTKGVTNLRGYYKQPEATSESIDQDGWFHTGDIGEIDEDGFIKITDRKKDLIKTSGGKYVAPQLIEGQLKLDPLVSQAVVIGDQRKYVTALVALNSDIAKKHLAELGESVPGDAGQLIAHPAIQKRIQGRLDSGPGVVRPADLDQRIDDLRIGNPGVRVVRAEGAGQYCQPLLPADECVLVAAHGGVGEVAGEGIKQHHRRHDVIGQNSDPVRPLGSDARGIDEDEIRRVRRIDLLDPAIHGPHALDGRRAQER